MARTKQTLNEFLMSANNLFDVHAYLSRAIRDDRILSLYGKDWNKRETGKNEFQELSLVTDKNTNSVKKYSLWIETYLSDEQWEKCKTAIRQKKLAKKRKYKYRSYRLPEDACNKLSYYANVKGLTKVKALEMLINVAYKKC
jgi:hypothetical protein